MASFSNLPTTVALIAATKLIKGSGGHEDPGEDHEGDPEELWKAFMLILYIMFGIPLLVLSWIIATSFIGEPEYTRTDVGIITTIDARPYKGTFYYELTTSEGYSLDFYKDEPVLGETVYKSVTKRKFRREVSYTVQSGGSTGYTQIWPFMKED